MRQCTDKAGNGTLEKLRIRFKSSLKCGRPVTVNELDSTVAVVHRKRRFYSKRLFFIYYKSILTRLTVLTCVAISHISYLLA